MVLRFEMSLLTCGTDVWDTSIAKAWMFCGNRRAMALSTTGTYRHVMSALSVRVSNKPILSRRRMGVQRIFQLVTVYTMGPISSQALGGYTYAAKFVDQHTKWKEIFLVKKKTQTVDFLELFNKGLMVPTSVRLDRLKADKGTESCFQTVLS